MHHFTRHSLFRIDLMFLKLGSPITLTSVDGAKSKRKAHTCEVDEPTQPKAAMKYLSMADALAVPLCRYELGNKWK
jgi:hypothetical protein